MGNFAAAVGRHVASGMEYLDRERILARAEVCRGCPLFDGQVCTHASCGCKVSDPDKWLVNKLAWASEQCPERYWPGEANHAPYQITRTNLIFHCTPFAANDIWLRNVRQLLKRWPVFTGRKIVAIATDSRTLPAEAVEQEFPAGTEFLHYQQSARQREAVSWIGLCQAIASTDPAEATFYAHSKGVTRQGHKGVEFWRNAMYAALLDQPERVRRLLETHAMVGTHRIHHAGGNPNWKACLRTSDWHFSGTFWWFRHSDFFANERWRMEVISRNSGWVIEALPGLLFDEPRTYCIAYEDHPNPYDSALYPDPISDEPTD